MGSFDWLTQLVLDPGIPAFALYAVVFVSCIVESFFPPWPTDIVVVYAGFLAGRGQLDPRIVLGAAIGGTQVGVMAVFWIARHWGRALLEGRMGRILPAQQIGRLEEWFARYGASAIAVSRFLPGIRALVMPAAGLARFSTGRVLCWAGASVVIWNGFVVGLGIVAGTHLDWATGTLIRYNTVALGVGLAAVLGGGVALLYRLLVRRAAGS
jgi:membrane protein DedA with SNARE-associated domain